MTEFLCKSLSYLSPERAELLERLVERTCLTASKMNITSRKSEAEAVFYHIADSLSVVADVRGASRVCDVGTGGGFPGLVLAVLCPETQFVLLDATAKKVRAIEETAEALGLSNVRGLCARAEEAGRGEFRETFDVVISRATAALPMLSELCLPLLRVGGKFVAMKGPRFEEELSLARPILSRMGIQEPKIRTEALSAENFYSLAEASEEEMRALDSFCAMERFVLVFEKKKLCPPKYPRPFAQISRGGV